MEGIVVLILIVIGWAIFRWLLSAGARTVGAAAKAAMGKGSFSDNMTLAFQDMGVLEVRLREIEGKGIFPLNQAARIGFVTSVFDNTSGELKPVISAIEAFQESGSVVYQQKIEVGDVTLDQGFVSWARVGIVIPAILQPPYGGQREMVAILRMVDLDNTPEITHGFHTPEHPGLLWQKSLPFSYTFTEKGYSEAAEHRDEARALALKIGMAVAMADGSLDDSEGSVLKEWIIRMIEPFSEEKQESLKQLYNKAMKDAFSELGSGDMSLSSITQRLNEIGDLSTKYEVIELCFDVLSADGVFDSEEIKVIRKVAEALDLDLDEIEKMRDKSIVGLNASVSTHASIEDLLGIESDWDKEQTKRHLRTEFQKWNNRLNTLSEGEERSNAQRMLDLIAEARKKYV